MLKFCHTYLYFKDLIRTYFYGIDVILWDLIGIKIPKFQVPNLSARSAGGRPDQWSVDRYARGRAHGQPTWLVDRTVDRLRAPHSRVGAGRPGGRPLAKHGRPGGRPQAHRSEK